MSIKVYLSPSNQSENQYAYGNTTEMIQCNKIAESAEKYLKASGFEIKRAKTGQGINASINESNNWGANVHVCIHTNAGGGSGCEVYVYKKDSENLKYATPVYNAISALTTSSDRGIKTANFAEIKGTNAVCVYCECEFHDNSVLAKWIVNNTDAIGKAIASGLCKAVGKSLVTESKPSTGNSSTVNTNQETLYRVQTGAFKNKSYADAAYAKVKAAGFPTCMVLDGGLYKIQVGAYKVKSNADAMANKLEAAGFKTYISTKGGKAVSASKLKSVDTIAKEVIRGDWGNGSDRRNRLTKAGYDPDVIQKRVNELLK